MKTIKFRPNLVPLVLSGEKTSTWRLFDDKDLSIGDEISMLNKETLVEFAKAKITAIEEKKLGELVDDDFSGHECYESIEERYKTYRGYYGDRVTSETIAKIIDFEII
ncbi:MAG: ASCH domain-containing protein [Candidatus Uhrbacteria bacterium]